MDNTKHSYFAFYMLSIQGTQAPAQLTDIPPIVTAVASADFYQVQSLIKQWIEEIKPHIPNAKFIIYDIGLYKSESDLVGNIYGFSQNKLKKIT